MKAKLIFGAVTMMVIGVLSSCNDCKTCQAEVMGIKGPSQEFCGEELKKAENTPGMVCK